MVMSSAEDSLRKVAKVADCIIGETIFLCTGVCPAVSEHAALWASLAVVRNSLSPETVNAENFLKCWLWSTCCFVFFHQYSMIS